MGRLIEAGLLAAMVIVLLFAVVYYLLLLRSKAKPKIEHDVKDGLLWYTEFDNHRVNGHDYTRVSLILRDPKDRDNTILRRIPQKMISNSDPDYAERYARAMDDARRVMREYNNNQMFR